MLAKYSIWGLLFLILCGIGWLAADLAEGLRSSQKGLLLILNLLNAAIPVLVLAALNEFIPTNRHKLWRLPVAVLAAFWLLYSAADFLLFKRLGTHAIGAFRLLSDDGISQCLLFIKGTGIRPADLALNGAILVGAPLGLTFLLWTWLWASKCQSPVWVTRCLWGTALVMGFLLLGFQVYALYDQSATQVCREWHRTTPLCLGWAQPPAGAVFKGARLRPLQAAKNSPVDPAEREPATTGSSTAGLLNNQATFGVKPDIFLFVIDSLRGDFITADVAPCLNRFQADCLRVKDTLAASDASHISWYSLLTANHGLRAGPAFEGREGEGSKPLRLLAQAGYEIHVIAATHLHYRNIDRTAFGDRLQFATSFFDERDMPGVERPERDRTVNHRLMGKIHERAGGRFFIIAYDSTHHDYYWSENEPAPFQPITRHWRPFDVRMSQSDLEKVINRYRNAIHYVDSLLGVVLDELKRAGRYDNSLLFVTSDHGEEFLEHGKLVHASEACRAQTHVPWLLKPPQGSPLHGNAAPIPVAVSHVDFLPTVFDVLQIDVSGDWDGESIWHKTGDYVLVAHQNGRRCPQKFCIQSGSLKTWFQYSTTNPFPYREDAIYLQKITDTYDAPVHFSADEQRQLALDHLRLTRLFPEVQ